MLGKDLGAADSPAGPQPWAEWGTAAPISPPVPPGGWLPGPNSNLIMVRTSLLNTRAKFSFMMSNKIHMFFI